MESVKNETIDNQLSWRYATKRFDPSKKISDANWATLKNTLVQSPSSFGLQPWKFISVQNTEMRKELQAAAWNQPQIIEASHLVVFAAKRTMTADDIDRLIKKIATERDIPEASLQEYKGMMLGFLVPPLPGLNVPEWTTRQVYLALGMVLSSAALLGIDACPMEGFVPPQFDEILGLSSSDFTSKVICTFGYRSSEDKTAHFKKVRFSESEVFEVK